MESETFSIFFLCEDHHALNRALKLKNRLIENCQGEVAIEASFLEFARLCHPRLKEKATIQAMAADMIIITANGADGMPTFAQNWMNQLTQTPTIDRACAVFLQTESPDEAATFHQFITKWSKQNGAAFFSNLMPESPFDFRLGQPIHPGDQSASQFAIA